MYALQEVAPPGGAHLVVHKDGVKADLYNWMVDLALDHAISTI